jgi:hypothetical protein
LHWSDNRVTEKPRLACGFDLPIAPEKILRALAEKDGALVAKD